MQAEDLRLWVDGRRFVEEYERRLAVPEEPEVSWQRALSLFALLDRMIGWPVAPDEIRRHEDETAERAWMRLREDYRRRS
jgi:hypothetical protein